MFKKILKVISNALFIFLLIVLAIVFYSWYQVSIMNKPYSEFLGYSIFEVVTGSMSGTIEIDDYIIVKKQKNYNIKDVITFNDGDSIVTHRIMQIKGNTLITRGDANNANDIEIKLDNVIGKVVFVIPNGSIWKKVFTDYKVIIFILITLLCFTLYSSSDPKLKEKNEFDDEKMDDVPIMDNYDDEASDEVRILKYHKANSSENVDEIRLVLKEEIKEIEKETEIDEEIIEDKIINQESENKVNNKQKKNNYNKYRHKNGKNYKRNYQGKRKYQKKQ